MPPASKKFLFFRAEPTKKFPELPELPDSQQRTALDEHLGRLEPRPRSVPGNSGNILVPADAKARRLSHPAAPRRALAALRLVAPMTPSVRLSFS